MPIRKIADAEVEYYLIVFDESGRELLELDGSVMSATLVRRAANATEPLTDVFFMSHGWKGDVPAAVEQYDRWVGAMAMLQSDRVAACQRRPGFAPLIVGLHWPSLPWGDETIPTGGSALPSWPLRSLG